MTPASGAMPHWVPCVPSPARVPVTCEPWPWESVRVLVSVSKFQPWMSSVYPLLSSSMPLAGTSPGLVQRWSAMSGWVRHRPVSMTPTVTPWPV